MKKVVLFTFLFNQIFLGAQDTLSANRWSHEVKINFYSDLIFYGGQELNYQTNFRISDNFKFGARIGFFYHKRKEFNYEMLPFYLTSELSLGKNKSICMDIGTPLLLNEDSKRMNAIYPFWASSDYTPSFYAFRKRIIFISQFSFKFRIYKGIRASIGLNNYWGSNTTSGSWFVTVGLKGGVAYQF